VTFFSSRWVEVPAHVTETPDAGLPPGFRAGGVACGIKASGALDLGLLVCDSEACTSAARFTRSGVLAAPVLVTKEHARLDALRAVVVNSGNANAATGQRGLDEAARMQGAAALAGRVGEDQVAVASTGVIGVQLPGDDIIRGLHRCREQLRGDGGGEFATAIMTTDSGEKQASLTVELPGGTVRLTGQAKGAGMMQPNFATMLCFVQTDAVLSAETADLLLGVCVKRSFDRISVDGQLSTNDTAILMCSGESGVAVEPESGAERAFGEALDALLRQLAVMIVADGEGSRRIGRVVVYGGAEAPVRAAAYAVANSPLVKTALHGGDPNWGRIAQAIGGALLDADPLALDIAIEGVQVCVAGAAVAFDESDLQARVARDEVEFVIGLPGSGYETEVLFSDLGHEYITINAEYTT
jgi:glutamate N-acetyltransferase / amino-acid N-acetyltransferase